MMKEVAEPEVVYYHGGGWPSSTRSLNFMKRMYIASVEEVEAILKAMEEGS